MLTGPNVILTLKIAVAAVTVLLIAALIAVARGNYRLHGRLNLAFFTLTLIAVLGLELVVRIIAPNVFDYINNDSELRHALNVHLWFSVPSTFLMPAMLYTGLKGYVRVHLTLAVCFAVLWTGTVITGIFFLPPTPW
ncbi:MAG TPA: DUF420 domain-containing protein [Gemmataceae bacterium]|nr:DUF420 domain-containing protein [Gemmataceae bacterium]